MRSSTYLLGCMYIIYMVSCVQFIWPTISGQNSCTRGAVRLTGIQETTSAGRVELCNGRTWGAICDTPSSYWSTWNAHVACQSAGFPRGAANSIASRTYVGRGHRTFTQSALYCFYKVYCYNQSCKWMIVIIMFLSPLHFKIADSWLQHQHTLQLYSLQWEWEHSAGLSDSEVHCWSLYLWLCGSNHLHWRWYVSVLTCMYVALVLNYLENLHWSISEQVLYITFMFCTHP